VPVFMSSLMQVPMIQLSIGPRNDVGILCAQKMGSNYKIAGCKYHWGYGHNQNVLGSGARLEAFQKNLWRSLVNRRVNQEQESFTARLHRDPQRYMDKIAQELTPPEIAPQVRREMDSYMANMGIEQSLLDKMQP